MYSRNFLRGSLKLQNLSSGNRSEPATTGAAGRLNRPVRLPARLRFEQAQEDWDDEFDEPEFKHARQATPNDDPS